MRATVASGPVTIRRAMSGGSGVRDGTMDPYTAALTILDDATAVDRLTRR